MRDIAFIDADGIIFDTTKRDRRATDQTVETIKALKPYLSEKDLEDLRKKIFYHPDMFYHSALIEKDTLIPGAREHLLYLHDHGWDIVILTSLPEYRRKDREASLKRFGIPYTLLQCKDTDAFQYVKTAEWKRATIKSLAQAMEATRIIVVDDDIKNIEAIQKDEEVLTKFKRLTFMSLESMRATKLERITIHES